MLSFEDIKDTIEIIDKFSNLSLYIRLIGLIIKFF